MIKNYQHREMLWSWSLRFTMRTRRCILLSMISWDNSHIIYAIIIGRGSFLLATLATLSPQIQSGGLVTLNSWWLSRPINGPVTGMGHAHHPSMMSRQVEPRIQKYTEVQNTEMQKYWNTAKTTDSPFQWMGPVTAMTYAQSITQNTVQASHDNFNALTIAREVFVL